jgi:hypothetical protein
MIGDCDCGAMGGMKIGRVNWSTRRKPAVAPLCSPQIPHHQTRPRTLTAVMGSQRLIAELWCGLYFSLKSCPIIVIWNQEAMQGDGNTYDCMKITRHSPIWTNPIVHLHLTPSVFSKNLWWSTLSSVISCPDITWVLLPWKHSEFGNCDVFVRDTTAAGCTNQHLSEFSVLHYTNTNKYLTQYIKFKRIPRCST